jgi:large subunit ribosomal protein L31
MKTGIHPTQHEAQMTCGTCGANFEVRTTAGDLTLDACSNCHPAYTGRAARTVGGGRIERFERRYSRSL